MTNEPELDRSDDVELLAEQALDLYGDMGAAYEYEDIQEDIWLLVENSVTLRAHDKDQQVREEMEDDVAERFREMFKERYDRVYVHNDGLGSSNLTTEWLEANERATALDAVKREIDLSKATHGEHIGWVLPDGNDTDVKIVPDLVDLYGYDEE